MQPMSTEVDRPLLEATADRPKAVWALTRRSVWILLIGLTASLLVSAATVTIIVAATTDSDTKSIPLVLGESCFVCSVPDRLRELKCRFILSQAVSLPPVLRPEQQAPA